MGLSRTSVSYQLDPRRITRVGENHAVVQVVEDMPFTIVVEAAATTNFPKSSARTARRRILGNEDSKTIEHRDWVCFTISHVA